MTGRQKILQVLKYIKRESEISPYPEWINFRFNDSLVGLGVDILTDDQEKRILMKLELEGVLEIHLPNGKDEQTKAILSQYTPTELMMDINAIPVKILPLFHAKYFWYNLFSFDGNKWNIINPFWILWKMIEIVSMLINNLWHKNKSLTVIIGTFSAILVYDWTLAWKNIGIVLFLIKKLLNVS